MGLAFEACEALDYRYLVPGICLQVKVYSNTHPNQALKTPPRLSGGTLFEDMCIGCRIKYVRSYVS